MAILLERGNRVEGNHRHQVQDRSDDRAGQRFDEVQDGWVEDRNDPGEQEYEHGYVTVDAAFADPAYVGRAT